MSLAEQKNLTGCCGMYCGLCPRYQTTAKSKCPGCKTLSLTISCKLYNCCVKTKGLATCAECGDFPCEKYQNFFDRDSFVTHKVCRPNLDAITRTGLRKWLAQKRQQQVALERLLAKYDEGRSKTFLCTAVALMPPDLIKQAVREAERLIAGHKTKAADAKTRAKAIKSAVQNYASRSGVDLKLRTKTT